MIEITCDTALATVQDLGRAGGLNAGVGCAGAMDPLALAAGNLLLGNDAGAAGIEMQVFPFQLRFTEACAFALTGADCAATLDGETLLPWWTTTARAGQTLTLSPPRAGAWRASRAYLCVAGGIDVPLVLGSRSTQMRGAFGGFHGRPLCRGDILRAGPGGAHLPGGGLGIEPPALALPLALDATPAVRVIPAAEYHRYTKAAQDALWSTPWRVTPQSDRYGFRLAGPTLAPLAPIELRSHGIVPGVIQVPHGGQPIVQMRDAQPSGGYPKIGTIIEADLWRFGQAPIGSAIRFIRCGWDEAVAAGADVEHWLARTARLAALSRQHASAA